MQPTRPLNHNTININTIIYFSGLLLFIVLNYATNFDKYIVTGLSISLVIFLRLINETGKSLPIKELVSILLLIQIFISPLIAYRYFNNKAHFLMYVNESVYMAYAIPASIFFIIGLFIPIYVNNNYKTIFSKLNTVVSSKTEKIAFIFILLGLSASFFNDLFPISIAFIVYLLKLLKFIGAFIFLFSQNKLKYVWVGLVYVLFFYEIVNGGVFYDLFVWVFFLYMLLETKLKSSFFTKILIVLTGFYIIYFIQSIKADYRNEAWDEHNKTENTEIFINVIEEKTTEDNLLNNESDLNKFVSRLNSGWILSKVMSHTPKNQPYTNGETLKEDLINTLLPRFLFQNKAITGGKQNQEKFTKFTGRRLVGGTTMRIGAISDGYINFGVIGGIITMFFLGLLINLILAIILRLNLKNPIYILWIPFVFAYVIRMSDLQVILNYTLKAFIFAIVVNYFFFKKDTNISIKEK